MSDIPVDDGWWMAADGRYYAPDVSPVLIGATGPHDPSLVVDGRLVTPAAPEPIEDDLDPSSDFLAEPDLIDPEITEITEEPFVGDQLDVTDEDTSDPEITDEAIDEPLAEDELDSEGAADSSEPLEIEHDHTEHDHTEQDDTQHDDTEHDHTEQDADDGWADKGHVAATRIDADVDDWEDDPAEVPDDGDEDWSYEDAEVTAVDDEPDPHHDAVSQDEIANEVTDVPLVSDGVLPPDSGDWLIGAAQEEPDSGPSDHDHAGPASPDQPTEVDPRSRYRDAMAKVGQQIERGRDRVIQAHKHEAEATNPIEAERRRSETLDAVARLNQIATYTPDVDETERLLAESLNVSVHRRPHTTWTLDHILTEPSSELSRRLFALRWSEQSNTAPSDTPATGTVPTTASVTPITQTSDDDDEKPSGFLPVWAWVAALFVLVMGVAGQLVSSGGNADGARPEVAGISETSDETQLENVAGQPDTGPTESEAPSGGFRLELTEDQLIAAEAADGLSQYELLELSGVALNELVTDYGLSLERIFVQLTTNEPPITVSRAMYDDIVTRSETGTDEARLDLFRATLCELVVLGVPSEAVAEDLASTTGVEAAELQRIVDLTAPSC